LSGTHHARHTTDDSAQLLPALHVVSALERHSYLQNYPTETILEVV